MRTKTTSTRKLGIKKIRMSTWDKKWSKLARELRPACEYCGSTQGLNAHHYVRRSIKSTRLMLANAIILCTSHHVFNHEFSAHKTPEAFKKWFMEKHPQRHLMTTNQSKIHKTERQAILEFKDSIA